MRLLITWLKWLWDGLDFAAQWFGGWPLFVGAVTGILTGVWGFILENGPMALLIASFIAAVTMILVDYGILLVKLARLAKHKHIALASELDTLTHEGLALARKHHLGSNKEEQEWVERVYAALSDELFSEQSGLASLNLSDKVQKLRLITMRISNNYHVRSVDVQRYRSTKHR